MRRDLFLALAGNCLAFLFGVSLPLNLPIAAISFCVASFVAYGFLALRLAELHNREPRGSVTRGI